MGLLAGPERTDHNQQIVDVDDTVVIEVTRARVTGFAVVVELADHREQVIDVDDAIAVGVPDAGLRFDVVQIHDIRTSEQACGGSDRNQASDIITMDVALGQQRGRTVQAGVDGRETQPTIVLKHPDDAVAIRRSGGCREIKIAVAVEVDHFNASGTGTDGDVHRRVEAAAPRPYPEAGR